MTGAARSHGRHTGVLIPLFSIPSTESWGVGEIPDIAPLARWLAAAGQDLLQLLPVNAMAAGQHSPYSAQSAMAIDPIFIAVRHLEDFHAAGGEQATGAAFAQRLSAARAANRVLYDEVRELKNTALRRAFERFRRDEWERGSARAEALRRYIEEQAWWLDDFALFRVLHDRFPDRGWTDWPEDLRRRDRGALEQVRGEAWDAVLFEQYLQWVAESQWQAARAQMAGVQLFGDFPFMVATDSADVWARQEEFDLEASVGTPPDAFSEKGQDWGLPVYRWDMIAEDDFAWLRQRARRTAALFDGYRVDHLVGFYRTYVRPPKGRGKPFFWPADEPDQLALGERLMRMFKSSGRTIIAEDLGTVPDFVRDSLARLELPGYKVLRWEREWEEPDQPFRDPAAYAEVSIATSGTHDTDPLAIWWDEAPEDERAAIAELPIWQGASFDPATVPFDARVRDLLLETLIASASNLVILPMQDIFGWRDRINVPGEVSDENWTYRLPWPVDRLFQVPEAQERATQLRTWSVRHRRAL